MLIKLIIDVTMTVLMLVAMAYQITGNLVHEVVGVVLLALFIVHNMLNRHWYKAILKRKYNIRRMLGITVNLLFLVSMATVIISSVPISRDILAFIPIPIKNDMFFMQIHVMTSYWGFIFMAIHIGMSWGTIINAIRRMTGIAGTSRIRTLSLRLLAVLIVVYGVQSSFERNLGTKLTIYDPFGLWATDVTMIRFLIDYLSIMGIYICGTHYVLKFVRLQEKNEGLQN
ncbi:DUF4405 domain-containing protein [Paenibacillus thalictri]|nr:DUF4405 domain-containing protein [Paenibacillus thalictri]